EAGGPWCLRRRRGWIVLALPAEVGELALELGDAPAGLPLAGQCRLEPLGQALDLGPTLLGARLERRLEARLLRPETLRKARELGRTLRGARFERCLDARLLRSFSRRGFQRGRQPRPFPLGGSQRRDQELHPVGIG